MKKIIALLLALIMVMGLATVVSADETTAAKKVASPAATYTQTYKAYTLDGATDDTLYPHETLSFTVTADATNPDGGAEKVEVPNLTVNGNANQYLTINVPEFEKVGTYHFTITENEGATQGVGYAGGSVYVSVMVEYDYSAENTTDYLLKATVGVTSKESAKDYELTNTYDVGSLEVSKVVTGNLADQSVEFDMQVNLTSDQIVLSDITITDGSGVGADTTVAIDDWTKDGNVWKATANIKVKHGETVVFDNIPEGVTYEVVEDAKHGLGEDGFNQNSASNTDYTVTYAGKTGSIDSEAAAEATVTNEKKTTVDTGIVMDSVPFIVMAVVAVIGLAAFTAKKRVQE